MEKYLPFDSLEIYLFISKYLTARRLFLADLSGKEIFSIIFLTIIPEFMFLHSSSPKKVFLEVFRENN